MVSERGDEGFLELFDACFEAADPVGEPRSISLFHWGPPARCGGWPHGLGGYHRVRVGDLAAWCSSCTRGVPMTARKHMGRVAKVLPVCRAIRRAREDVGMSQGELARRLGVSQSMVARWESTSEPMLSVINRVETVLGMPRGDLLRAAGYVSDVVSVGRAVEDDPLLDERARRTLLSAYRSLVRSPNGSR